MIKVDIIKQLAEGNLVETDRFLVYVKVSKENVISVVIDGDTGVSIEHCIELSRYIEHKLDREKEDFELKVLSSGLEFPFAVLRQYKKYIGKRIVVDLNNGNHVQGVLQEADEEQIVLLEEIEKKYKKSIKVVEGEILKISMSDINKAKAVITFN